MRRLPAVDIDETTRGRLVELQSEVDAQPTFALQVEKAKLSFANKNYRGHSVFDAVKARLTTMCSGAKRCSYCQDSAADEIEHMAPKQFYPGLTFAWENYVYACGPCNSPKAARYAVFPSGAGSIVELVYDKDNPTPPPPGVHAILNPRLENVEDYLSLDLRDTFWFVPRHPPGTLEFERTEYTIEILGLNKRDVLPRARRSAYRDFCAHLNQYKRAASQGAETEELDRLVEEIRTRQHPSVWYEMKRQHAAVPKLNEMFVDLPAALSW